MNPLLRRALAAALLCAGLACQAPARAAPPPWPDVPYTQYAENLPLAQVLGEFAASFSLALQLDKGVAGTVNGRFNSKNPTEFIDRLGGVYGFVWTVHAGTLQVTRASQLVQRALPVSGNPAAIKRALTDMGVLDPRFGWGELPEQGIVLPGLTVVCPDSHTCTQGALGALAWGIGSSEAEHALATQTLRLARPGSMRVVFNGRLREGVTAKDMILWLIGRHTASGAAGHAVEFAGPAVRALPVEARLTLCNMAVEFAAWTGIVAPDDTTFAWLRGRSHVPAGADFERAIGRWRELRSDDGAVFDIAAAQLGELGERRVGQTRGQAEREDPRRRLDEHRTSADSRHRLERERDEIDGARRTVVPAVGARELPRSKATAFHAIEGSGRRPRCVKEDATQDRVTRAESRDDARERSSGARERSSGARE